MLKSVIDQVVQCPFEESTCNRLNKDNILEGEFLEKQSGRMKKHEVIAEGLIIQAIDRLRQME